MILEVAILQVRPHASTQFEAAFAEAQHIIGSMPGYLGHELRRNVADHEQGFRKSPQYRRWRELLHHFYDPFPTVEHFELVHGGLMARS